MCDFLQTLMQQETHLDDFLDARGGQYVVHPRVAGLVDDGSVPRENEVGHR